VDEDLKAGSTEGEATGGAAVALDQATVRRFEALAVPHTDAAYNLALRLVRQSEAAEDIVHDAFLRALRGFAAYQGGDARSWILTIVRNRAYDWLRERERRRTVSMTLPVANDTGDETDFDPPDPDQETPEETLIRKGEAARLHDLIEALPPVLREALVLREMEDLSYRQIAEITAAPIGSVMSRLARARAQLTVAWRRLHEAEGRT
jgi:RNA polymerase sigma-70 factor (ECF subfamily)